MICGEFRNRTCQYRIGSTSQCDLGFSRRKDDHEAERKVVNQAHWNADDNGIQEVGLKIVKGRQDPLNDR